MHDEKNVCAQPDKLLTQILKSELKLKILMALTKSKTVRELTDEIHGDLSAQQKMKRLGAMHSAVKAMKKSNIIYEDENGNNLTSFGKMLRSRVTELIELINTFNKHRDFWLTHNAKVIPEPFLNELHILAESELQYSKSDPYLSRRVVLEHIKNAEEELYYITPIIELDWSLAVLDKVDKGVNVKAIVDVAMLKKLTTEKGFKENIPKRFNRLNYEMKIIEEIPFGLLITEKSLALALPTPEEPVPDMTRLLVSCDSRAIGWGKALYKYMFDTAKPIKMDSQ